ncbi:MAG: hypothetical protein GTN76_15145, partial [Candidatus Aenigmarchaeota archaeon]|nr:hypothetical protein [Candidatus Aenigmarchaeota archaeon]
MNQRGVVTLSLHFHGIFGLRYLFILLEIPLIELTFKPYSRKVIIPELSSLYLSVFEGTTMEPPIRLLEKALNSTIIIRLKDNRELEGRLKSADSYMNLELTNATERDQEGNKIVKYGEL